MAREDDLLPPPEAVLIRRRRQARGWSVAQAAARVGKVVSGSRWAQIEQGYQIKDGQHLPTSASDMVLAHMARALDVEPEDLEDCNRGEAAEILRTMASVRTDEPRDPLDEAAAFFRDPTVPLEERRRKAEQLFKLLPYYVLGQEPPPGLLGGGQSGDSDSKRSA